MIPVKDLKPNQGFCPIHSESLKEFDDKISTILLLERVEIEKLKRPNKDPLHPLETYIKKMYGAYLFVGLVIAISIAIIIIKILISTFSK